MKGKIGILKGKLAVFVIGDLKNPLAEKMFLFHSIGTNDDRSIRGIGGNHAAVPSGTVAI